MWGDLLLGFSWSWLVGVIYWGWFCWEFFWYLFIEAIGLFFVFWGLKWGWGVIGYLFYLGFLMGIVVMDFYFYFIGLMDYWW